MADASWIHASIYGRKDTGVYSGCWSVQKDIISRSLKIPNARNTTNSGMGTSPVLGMKTPIFCLTAEAVSFITRRDSVRLGLEMFSLMDFISNV